MSSGLSEIFVYLDGKISGKGHFIDLSTMTFQKNINLHMFRDEFVVKNGFLTSAYLFLFLFCLFRILLREMT